MGWVGCVGRGLWRQSGVAGGAARGSVTIAVPVLKRPCSSATLHLAACLRFAAEACACAACRGAAAPPHVQVKPGPEGYRQFTEAIRRAFNLPDDSELNITFTCDEPTTGSAGAVAAWGIGAAAGAATAAVWARRHVLSPPSLPRCWRPTCMERVRTAHRHSQRRPRRASLFLPP
jgi:hypothetical protein